MSVGLYCSTGAGDGAGMEGREVGFSSKRYSDSKFRGVGGIGGIGGALKDEVGGDLGGIEGPGGGGGGGLESGDLGEP